MKTIINNYFKNFSIRKAFMLLSVIVQPVYLYFIFKYMWELESGLILFTNLLDFFIFLIIFFRFKVFIFLLYFPCFIILQYLLSLPFNPNDMPFTVNDINLGATGFFLLFAMAVGDFFTHEGKVINILFNWCSEVFNVFLFNSTV